MAPAQASSIDLFRSCLASGSLSDPGRVSALGDKGSRTGSGGSLGSYRCSEQPLFLRLGLIQPDLAADFFCSQGYLELPILLSLRMLGFEVCITSSFLLCWESIELRPSPYSLPFLPSYYIRRIYSSGVLKICTGEP